MRMRSTGLGKTELVAEVEDLKRMGGFLILVIATSQPVKWKVRAAMTHKDLFKLFRLMLRWSNLKYLIFNIGKKESTDIPAF
ncbi:MAG: hypothetical protein HY673_21215 [Chloroflexi bacterium]|nr:hypothetical protein [Chloroflexota bacterium]